jgi:lysozyme
MSATRQINGAGLALVKEYEGLRLTAYKDSGGLYTIGYGHVGPHIRPGMRITEAQAEAFLLADLGTAEQAVSRLVKPKQTNNEFSALVSLVFNIGTGHFADSDLLKHLNSGDDDGATAEWMKWVYVAGKRSKGLVRRRAEEVSLFNRA